MTTVYLSCIGTDILILICTLAWGLLQIHIYFRETISLLHRYEYIQKKGLTALTSVSTVSEFDTHWEFTAVQQWVIFILF